MKGEYLWLKIPTSRCILYKYLYYWTRALGVLLPVLHPALSVSGSEVRGGGVGDERSGRGAVG